jgi:hypothetical protein
MQDRRTQATACPEVQADPRNAIRARSHHPSQGGARTVSGYVRLHRRICGHHAFRNDSEAMAFSWMVLRAAWQPIRVRYKDRQLWLQRGQLAVSQRDMASAMDRDKAWVERLWKRLRAEAMIMVDSEAGVAVITICNYNEYQAETSQREAADEAPSEAGARQAQGTEQEREEGKEERISASQSVARQPISEAVSFFNENAAAAGWPCITKLSDGRRRALGARLREHGLDGWKAAIVRARASPFLGHDPPAWFNFNFLIKPDGILKVIEGNYDRRNSDCADPTLVALARFGEAGNGG